MNKYYSGGDKLARATWTKNNIKVVIKPPEDKRNLKRLKEVWNKWVAKEINKVIGSYSENIRDEIINEIIKKIAEDDISLI